VLQFLGWDQVSRNHVSQFAANYTGNQIVANEFLYNVTNQIIYNQSGVQVIFTPFDLWDTDSKVLHLLKMVCFQHWHSNVSAKVRFWIWKTASNAECNTWIFVSVPAAVPKNACLIVLHVQDNHPVCKFELCFMKCLQHDQL